MLAPSTERDRMLGPQRETFFLRWACNSELESAHPSTFLPFSVQKSWGDDLYSIANLSFFAVFGLLGQICAENSLSLSLSRQVLWTGMEVFSARTDINSECKIEKWLVLGLVSLHSGPESLWLTGENFLRPFTIRWILLNSVSTALLNHKELKRAKVGLTLPSAENVVKLRPIRSGAKLI